MKLFTLIFTFYFAPTWVIQGLQHPFLTPAHAIILVAIAFFIGMHSGLYKYLLTFVLAVFLGMFGNYLIEAEIDLESVLLVFSLIIGLLLALKLKLEKKLIAVSFIITVIAGFLLGLDSSPVPIPGIRLTSHLNWYFGALLSVLGSVVLISLLAFVLNRFWQGIITRVLGSWIATSALITLTLYISKI